MAFDFLGTIVRSQWDALSAFVQASKDNRASMITDLEFSISQQDKFSAKMMLAEGTTGGTSISGFSGATYTPADRADGLHGEYRRREHQDDPPLNGLLQYLLERAPDRESFIEVDGETTNASNGNFGGGDLPWMDIPKTPQFANPAGASDDRRTFPLVQRLKDFVAPQIEFQREHLELQLKQALDRREQLLILLYLLNEATELVGRVTKQIGDQFHFADPGLQVDDPEADAVIDNDTTVGLLDASDELSEGIKMTNLWVNYPATRVFPSWPMMPPKERGNLAKVMPDDPSTGGSVSAPRKTVDK